MLKPTVYKSLKKCKISKYEYLIKVRGNTGRTDGKSGKKKQLSLFLMDTLLDPSTQRSHPFKIRET